MTGPYVRFDLERVLKGSCSQNKQTKGEKPLAMPRSLIVQIGSRNCIGFGSGVLGGFAGFWGVLGGFAGFCRVLLLLLFSGLRAVGWFCRVLLLLLFSGLREVGSWALVCSGLCGLGSFNRGLLFFPRSGFEKLYRVWVRSFAGFWGVLLLLLQFDFWIWGRAGFWLGWAVLGWAVFLFALEFDFGILGTAAGFCFLLLPFWLGWAGLGCRWAWLGWALLTHVLGKIRNE